MPTPLSAIQFTASSAAPDLPRLYEYRESPCLRVNFVSSIDGAAMIDGASGGLSSPLDKKIFGLLRELADVVIVGAGTARAEGYSGARIAPAARQRRIERGQQPVPPIAVVTGRADLDAAHTLFTSTEVPPLVITSIDADPGRKHLLREAGGEVIELAPRDGQAVHPGDVLAVLHERGLGRMLCEGGPSLLGAMLRHDLVDELCLTIAPVLVGGDAPRIAVDPTAVAHRMRLAHTLADGDGSLFTRWARAD
ncbi:pyrimidine reductase family protein [Lolliginicoccus suaedae]|uniref:pyrimidine reductase family protein n=1 Tax=Lolliginicoccus suaedae TaxID=2605429 RepID=UPI001F1BEDDA|nr:pyrimidine reductase family protein [Lolliginicoccus suaedae]